MPECPFGATWEELSLDVLEAFFSVADPNVEPLTWEAKGHTLVRAERIRREICGFANQIGGFLVLGVSNESGRWMVDGVEIPGGEPRTWIEQVARSQLSPQPKIECLSWPVGESGRHVVVLRVEPVSVAPCLYDGRVFQRVSGRSDPVSDQRVLLDLTSRGQAALDRADSAARECARALTVKLPFDQQSLKGRVCVAMAPAAGGTDAPRRVFRQSWEDLVHEALLAAHDGFPPLDQVRPEVAARHRAVGSMLRLRGAGFEGEWSAESRIDGTVAVHWSKGDGGDVEVATAAGPHILGRLWAIAAHLVEALGGLPPVAMAVGTTGRGSERQHLRRLSHPIERRLDALGAPSREALEDIKRGLLRAQGVRASEPEPAPRN